MYKKHIKCKGWHVQSTQSGLSMPFSVSSSITPIPGREALNICSGLSQWNCGEVELNPVILGDRGLSRTA